MGGRFRISGRPCQGGNTGSNAVGDANEIKDLQDAQPIFLSALATDLRLSVRYPAQLSKFNSLPALGPDSRVAMRGLHDLFSKSSPDG